MRSVRPALYAGITTTTFGRGPIASSEIGVEAAPASGRDHVPAPPREPAHHAAPGIDARHEEDTPAALPRRLQARRVPEEVARVGERRAEGEVRLQAVHRSEERRVGKQCRSRLSPY